MKSKVTAITGRERRLDGQGGWIEAQSPDDLRNKKVIQRPETLCEIYPSLWRVNIRGWPVHERIELPHLTLRTGHRVYHTTGLSRDEIIDLCILINSEDREPDAPRWPPSLGLFKSVTVAMVYMRTNLTQAQIGEFYGVSQPTISRAVKVINPLISRVTAEFVPTADDLDPGSQYIIDGTLFPCWSWKGCEELYSGKHKTTGLNVQVACTIYGKLAWVSDPVTGKHHDSYCLGESGVLTGMNARNWMGDKGYVGNDMITPFKKPPGGELLDWQKEFNSQVNKIRWKIEQVISHLKNWAILRTGYRRPLRTFPETISAVIGLQFYKEA